MSTADEQVRNPRAVSVTSDPRNHDPRRSSVSTSSSAPVGGPSMDAVSHMHSLAVKNIQRFYCQVKLVTMKVNVSGGPLRTGSSLPPFDHSINLSANNSSLPSFLPSFPLNQSFIHSINPLLLPKFTSLIHRRAPPFHSLSFYLSAPCRHHHS